MITALAGGVGASKFLQGLAKLVPLDQLTVIVNTADDIELYGLHVSPDLDTILYTLANVVDEEKGWGIKGDTFHFLRAMRRLGHETWFKIGDRDLATHVYRTSLLNKGLRLSDVTNTLCEKFGVKCKILPMTDDKVETKVLTDEGPLNFQEYFVKRKFEPSVKGVTFKGIEGAKPAPGVLSALKTSRLIIVCPSNPIVSIAPILSIRGVREAVKASPAKKVAISPLVRGRPLRGPADRLMRGLGMEPSAKSIAELYKDFLNAFIIDKMDVDLKPKIEKIGLKVVVTNTIMKTLDDKVRLAKVVLRV
jgi:LPPG:FO 2-phospho-L-lactate transferase